jgi:predicted nucleotidyltransferase
MYGLRETDIAEINKVLAQFDEVHYAIIFGSRAKGNYRNGSDVDIALKGDHLSHHNLIRISSILNEETMMPYRFDVLDYYTITNSELIAHIDSLGKLLYGSQERAIHNEPNTNCNPPSL